MFSLVGIGRMDESSSGAISDLVYVFLLFGANGDGIATRRGFGWVHDECASIFQHSMEEELGLHFFGSYCALRIFGVMHARIESSANVREN